MNIFCVVSSSTVCYIIPRQRLLPILCLEYEIVLITFGINLTLAPPSGVIRFRNLLDRFSLVGCVCLDFIREMEGPTSFQKLCPTKGLLRNFLKAPNFGRINEDLSRL